MSLVVLNSRLNFSPNNLLRQLLTFTVDGGYLQPAVMQPTYQISFMKSRTHAFFARNSFLGIHSTVTWQFGVNVGGSLLFARYLQPQIITNSLRGHTIDEELQVDSSSESLESLSEGYNKETGRRKKIGIANKGKTPWNKGRKHSAETRERIKQRTIEALRDPKIKKKMSDCTRIRIHSEEIKAKIGASQRLVWRKRLKLNNLREKLYLEWTQCVAEAAKRGGCDQKELDWDSYGKLKAELALRLLQEAAEKAKAKEIAKLRVAREKSEKMARHAQKKKENEEKKAKARETKKTVRKKSNKEKQEVPVPNLKLMTRITKVRRKKKVDSPAITTGDIAAARQPVIEKLDLEFVRREKLRREVSLADQIQAAKKRREESAAKEALTNSSSHCIMDERSGQLVSLSQQHVHRIVS